MVGDRDHAPCRCAHFHECAIEAELRVDELMLMFIYYFIVLSLDYSTMYYDHRVHSTQSPVAGSQINGLNGHTGYLINSFLLTP